MFELARGQGCGGRATEFLLALASVLDVPAWALSCDPDGTEDNAGAWFGPYLARQISERGMNPADFLTRNDRYSCFATLDRLIMTGPTRTKLNDFRAICLRA